MRLRACFSLFFSAKRVYLSQRFFVRGVRRTVFLGLRVRRARQEIPMATKGKKASVKNMTKTQLIQAITDESSGLSKKQVKAVLESLTSIGHRVLKREGNFTLPGFAKFRVVKKPATKARKGVNPFTGEPTVFKAKPARRVVRVRPVKACKDAVG
jgi:nucleoid DNA-binding protein